MVDVLYTGDLDLDAVRTRESLAALLQTVYLRADKPSLRTLEAWTRKGPTFLSKNIAGDICKGARFPGRAEMVAFLRACGVPDDAIEQQGDPQSRFRMSVAGALLTGPGCLEVSGLPA